MGIRDGSHFGMDRILPRLPDPLTAAHAQEFNISINVRGRYINSIRLRMQSVLIRMEGGPDVEYDYDTGYGCAIGAVWTYESTTRMLACVDRP